MIEILHRGTDNVLQSLHDYYNIEFNVPLETEIKSGSNWLNMEVVHREIQKVIF